MKNWSGHIIFDQEFQWSALEKAFPEIWAIITRDIKQNQEDGNYDPLLLELNLNEIRENKKPQGYIKEYAKYKLIFPLDRKEMIIYRGIPSEEIHGITEEVAKVLKNKRIKHTVEYDKMLLIEIKSKRRYG
ncbi:MAG: hypothetical protein M1533_03060 [Candidatus Thermoplasmatota archaeon]|jgi:hypothetical protein|nr:hypothetical protein [Candidatus Thermoplasmatota archaeon]MCL5794462.1 hypothetical protein [Candidatus Thermoplasmatota archaeon]